MDDLIVEVGIKDEDEFDFDDFSESDGEWSSDNYHIDTHARLRRGSS